MKNKNTIKVFENVELKSMTNNLNILFLSPSPLMETCRGGIERSTEVCARNMMKRGHKCVVLSWGHVDADKLCDGIDQFIFPSSHKRGGKKNTEFYERILREYKIDIVVFQCGAGWYFPFPQSAKRVPVISVIRAVPDSYERRYRERYRGLKLWWNLFSKRIRQCKKYRFNYEVCARTVVLSQGLCPLLEKHLTRSQIKENRVSIVPNIATFGTKNIDFSKKQKELLFVGRINFSEKRPDRLLYIWEKLQEKFPDWSLRFVGNGEYLEELKLLSKKLSLTRVFFEGFQKPEPFYEKASIFCMTSEYESFGNVLTEAASFACVPVVFDAFPSARDIVDDGENGMLVPAFDLDAYAGTLAQLMSDNALRERLAKNALKTIPDKFSPEKICKRWENLFNEILQERLNNHRNKS